MSKPTTTQQLTSEKILAMPAGRDLDALVQAHVFGNPILGLARCWYDGGWMVMGAPQGDEWDRPAFLYRCNCDLREPGEDEFNPKIYGHGTSCLDIAPAYSERIEAAWEIMPWLQSKFTGFEIQWVDEDSECHRALWICHPLGGYAETAPLAICRAALLATLWPPV